MSSGKVDLEAATAKAHEVLNWSAFPKMPQNAQPWLQNLCRAYLELHERAALSEASQNE